MKNNLSMLRPSLAAVAAALALSATPAFAQADPAASPAAAPVTIAPPAPSVAPAPLAANDASAADQSSNMSAPVEETPAAVPMATRSPVVVHMTQESDAAAAPVVRTPVNRSIAKPAATPIATAAPAAKVALPAAVPAPVLRDPTPVARTAQTQTKVASTTQTDDTALYAGLGGAAILILGGGAVALGRRKRGDTVVDEASTYESAVRAVPAVATEPRIAAAPAVIGPVVDEAPEERELANGFDLSRFGPHTRAAYRGPTEDNPSLSLKKRLKIASFRDGRLRAAGAREDRIVDTPIDRSAPRTERTLFAGKFADRLRFRPQPRTGYRPATA